MSIKISDSEIKKQYNNIKQTLNQWQVIKTLNKLYKVDRILLKHAYDNYEDKKILEQSKQYKNIEKFYRYVFDHLFTIQRSYLNDQINIKEGQQQSNYQINKNSTSKFVRDEKENYQQVLKKYLQAVNQDQLAIHGIKLYQFVRDCFLTKFTQVIINGDKYFNGNNSYKVQFQELVKNYFYNVKDVDEESFRLENVWMGEDQILDFLSYWLKFYQGKQLYVLYCRTEEKLKKDRDYLKKEAENNRKKQQKGQKITETTHPLQLKKQLLQQNIKISQQIQQKVQDIQRYANKLQLKQNQQKISKISNILQKYRKNKLAQTQLVDDKEIKPKVKTKKEQLLDKLPELYQQGCRKRYRLSKNTTFDEIQSESKTMNLQKFINFCNYFGINTFLSRQLLSQIFKINAINRLVIDEKRFTKIIQTVIETDPKTIDCLLVKKQPKIKLKSESKLSNYKFMLRSINGKSVQTLQTQLQQKKITKQKNKQQKMNLYFLKKLKEKQKNNVKKQKTVQSSRIVPDLTSIYELQSMRDDKFDPEKFFGNDHDEMLSLYQSKFQTSRGYEIAPLQSILTKRLQKGTRILKKINSSNLKNYV